MCFVGTVLQCFILHLPRVLVKHHESNPQGYGPDTCFVVGVLIIPCPGSLSLPGRSLQKAVLSPYANKAKLNRMHILLTYNAKYREKDHKGNISLSTFVVMANRFSSSEK